MPSKMRTRKSRRVTAEPPAKAWAQVFIAGYDYLRRLAPYGLQTEAEIRAAAPDAWRRHGAAFLERWERGDPPGRTSDEPWVHKPWALREFGRPREDVPCR